MVDDDILRTFRMRVQQHQRQRWRVIEYDESIPEAVVVVTIKAPSGLGRGLSQRSVRRTKRRVFVDEDGEVRWENVQPPSSRRSNDAIGEQ